MQIKRLPSLSGLSFIVGLLVVSLTIFFTVAPHLPQKNPFGTTQSKYIAYCSIFGGLLLSHGIFRTIPSSHFHRFCIYPHVTTGTVSMIVGYFILYPSRYSPHFEWVVWGLVAGFLVAGAQTVWNAVRDKDAIGSAIKGLSSLSSISDGIDEIAERIVSRVSLLSALLLCGGLVILLYSVLVAYDVYPLQTQPPSEADIAVEEVIIGLSSIFAGLVLSIGLYGTYSGRKRVPARLSLYPLVTAGVVSVPHVYLHFSPEYSGDPSLWIVLGYVVGFLVAAVLSGVDLILDRPAAP